MAAKKKAKQKPLFNGYAQHLLSVGPVNTELANTLATELSPNAGKKQVVFTNISEGGDVHTALGLYDIIQYLGKIEMVAFGSIVSAGNIIFSAAAKRYSLPHTTFHFHQFSCDINEDLETTDRFVKCTKDLFKQAQDNLVKCGVSPKVAKKWMSSENFVRTPEALKEGYIDGIIDRPQGKLFYYDAKGNLKHKKIGEI